MIINRLIVPIDSYNRIIKCQRRKLEENKNYSLCQLHEIYKYYYSYKNIFILKSEMDHFTDFEKNKYI